MSPRSEGVPPLGHVPALDGVRGLAAALVVADHAFGLHNGGALGVEVFFVLSGFLITTLLLEEHASTGTIDRRAFYVRRALRLFPLLYAVLGLVLLATLALGPDRGWYLGSIAAAAAYVGNLYGVLGGHRGLAPALDHLWSLAVEEQFYVVWPLVLLAGLRRWGERRWSTWLLAGLAAACIVVRAATALTDRDIATLPTTYGDALLLGCLLATARRQGLLPPRRGERVAIGLALALAAVVVVSVPDVRFQDHAGGLGYSLLAAIGGLAVVVALDARVRVLAIRPLVALGFASYGLYVVHRPVQVLLEAHTRWARLPVGVATVAISVPLAWASRRWFEAWFLRRRPRPRAAPVSATRAP